MNHPPPLIALLYEGFSMLGACSLDTRTQSVMPTYVRKCSKQWTRVPTTLPHGSSRVGTFFFLRCSIPSNLPQLAHSLQWRSIGATCAWKKCTTHLVSSILIWSAHMDGLPQIVAMTSKSPSTFGVLDSRLSVSLFWMRVKQGRTISMESPKYLHSPNFLWSFLLNILLKSPRPPPTLKNLLLQCIGRTSRFLLKMDWLKLSKLANSFLVFI